MSEPIRMPKPGSIVTAVGSCSCGAMASTSFVADDQPHELRLSCLTGFYHHEPDARWRVSWLELGETVEVNQ